MTPTRLAEEQLRALEARFRTMADSAPMMIWVTDPTGTTTFVNQAFCDFVGITRTEGATFEWTSAVHAEDLAAYRAAFQAALRDRSPFHGRMRARRRDGAWRWLESRGRPEVEAGNVIAVVGCSFDMTDIIESQQTLREADRRKDEFLAVLAHELRNPLASITSGVQLLRRLAASEAEWRAARDMIEREAGQLSRLVDDLLDVSRITAGRIMLQTERLDLREVVVHAVEMTRPILESRGHRLTLDLPGRPLPVQGDATRLAQVFSNLLNNAAKYTNPRGHVRVTAAATPGQAEVRVSDDGIGIAPGDLQRIFDLFDRGERSRLHATGGLGIGLTLSRRLVEVHGGSVEASSEGPGRGSEFTVRLPLAASRSARGPRPSRPTPGTTAPVRRRRILVIDDNAVFADAMRSLLNVMGHDVWIIHDGADAVAAARAFQPHVVLLDIGLPGSSGYDVARDIRKDPALAKVTIAAVTGYGQEQDKAYSREAGIDHHLTKPVNDRALEALIDSVPGD